MAGQPNVKALLAKCKYLSHTVLGVPAVEEIKYWTPTGSLLLDLSISRNPKYLDIPNKKMTEIVGMWTHGKSALLGSILGQNQKRGGVSVLWDTEYGFIAEHATVLGLDVNSLAYIKTKIMEQGLGEIRHIVKGIREQDADIPIVVGWDGLSAAVTWEMIKRGYASGRSAEKAAACSEYFPILAAHIDDLNFSLIFTNQLRSQVREQGDYATGGRAVNFYKQLSISINKVGDIKNEASQVVNPEGEKISGILCDTMVKKNRIAPPFGKGQLYIDYQKGIYDEPLWFFHLKNCGYAEQAGAWLKIPMSDGKTVSINGHNDYLERIKDAGFLASMRECVLRSYEIGLVPAPDPTLQTELETEDASE